MSCTAIRTHTPLRDRTRMRPSLRRLATTPGLRELGLFAAVYAVYMVARWVLIADRDTALANAARIVEIEVALGIRVEDAVQSALAPLTRNSPRLLIETPQ